MERRDIQKLAAQVKERIQKVIVGKDETVELMLCAMIARGHVLLEDVPGTGKTVMAKSLAKSLSCGFARIQFTPDLLPSDVTGLSVYNAQKGDFEFKPGPVFTNILLADEINRATPRTQSALLECMEERQVTSDGVTRKLDEPFLVIATQNPVETQGTFPLPEAQLDRFFMRLKLGYMTREQEIGVLRRPDTRTLLEDLQPVVEPGELEALRKAYPEVRVSDDIAAYIMNLVDATRSSEMLLTGISTRGTLALYRACQIIAALRGRDYVIPEDVKLEALCVLPHRLTLVNQSHLDNVRYLQNLLDEIPVPLEQL